MQKRGGYYHFIVPIIFVSILLVTFIANLTNSERSDAATTVCQPGIFTTFNGSTSGTILNGLTNVNVTAGTSTTGNTITKVVILANGQPIGIAASTGTYTWNLPWQTSLHPNGPVSVITEIHYSDQTICNTATISADVQNATAGNVQFIVNPPDWQGPLSYSFPLNAILTADGVTFNLAPYAMFQWTTNIGNITSQQHYAQFFSGQTQGSGKITVNAKYGGKNVSFNIPIQVNSPDSPLPDDSTSTTNTTSTSGSTSSDDTTQQDSTTTTVARETSLQNNPVTQSCAQKILGEDRYNQINQGKSRPSPDEIVKLNACFATNNFILPSNFSPVVPTEVRNLNTTKKLAIAKLENAKKSSDQGESDVLKISGTAEPKSLVLIYVFSEPLVLTTTADDQGNWVYTLEDPIEPGNHEVYTVVNRGDGVYERSNPLSFIIGTAEAAENNPNGLSLQLAETTTPTETHRSMVWYIVGVITMVGLVAVAFLTFVIKRKKLLTVAVSSNNQPTLSQIDPSPTTPDNTQPMPAQTTAELETQPADQAPEPPSMEPAPQQPAEYVPVTPQSATEPSSQDSQDQQPLEEDPNQQNSL